MAEVLTLVGTPLVQLFKNHAKNFCLKCYNEVLWVEEDTGNLRWRLQTIEAVLTDAENCTKKSGTLKDWLKRLRVTSLDAEDALENYEAEAALRENNQLSPVVWWISRRIAAKNIKKILQKIEKCYDERIKLGLQSENFSPKCTWNSPSWDCFDILPEDGSRVIGREEEKEKIVKWFLSGESSNTYERIPVITITGMAGVGKTTLAQLVYNDERMFEKNDEACRFMDSLWSHELADFNGARVLEMRDEAYRFKKAAWVHVSKNFNVDKILKDIAYMLTEVVHEGGPQDSILKSIAKALCGNPLLLVLDDVWFNNKLAWEELHGCLRTFPKGTKVLATSRHDIVTTHLGAINTLRLGMLTKEHCWQLFSEEVLLFWEADLAEEKEAIGKEIVKKCQFLPLAVKLIGGILREKEVQYLEKTWKAAESHVDEGLSHIWPILVLSYDELSPILKRCFAYTYLFPKGHMFDKHDLVNLWVAEGFLQHSTLSGPLEEIGAMCFDTLFSRSFFQILKIDNKVRFKMHDLIHDLAKQVSITSQQVKDTNDYDIDTNCRHVSFLCKDIEKSTVDKLLRAQKLRTLLLPVSSSRDLGHALNKMFQTLRYMRVLDLSSSSIIELPESITQLKLLHYLDLSRNEIRLLPKGICKLLNLQILKLGCTRLQKLPNNFANLKDLRHLVLDDMFWYKCSKLPPRLGGLTNLHNLHRFHVHLKSGYKIKELKSMNRIEGLLHISNLENTINPNDARLGVKNGINKLILEWTKGEMSPQDQAKQEKVLQYLQPHENLEELQIVQYTGSRLSNWIGNGMLHKLYKISLNHCVNCRILSPGLLPHLRVLHIKGMLELEEWPENTSCPSLSRLTISHCPKLQNLPRLNFSAVKVVKIKQCDVLKALPPMPRSEYVILVNNGLLEDWGEIDNSLLTSFSTLIELEMVNCPKLMRLPRCFAPRKLKISGCPSLNALPSEDDSQKLQYLEIDSCNGPSLIETVQMSPSLNALTISNISNMPFLPELPNFSSLRSFYIHNCQQLESLSDEDGLGLLSNFTSLKFLSISECTSLTIFPDDGLPTSIECLVIKKCCNLQSIHGTNNYLKNLSALKDLYLEDCPKLESLPEDGLPDSLKHLCIRGCSLLTEYCQEGGSYWGMISNVADLELDKVITCESEAPLCCSGF